MTGEVRRIGRYRLDAVIGTGAFATVHRAFDERLDDTVAVKVLAENHSLDPEIRERFLGEGRVLRRIASPHVVTVHDLGETERQQPYLVLEYADRGTLRQRVADLAGRGWRSGVADVRAVAEPLADALAAVHRADVVHRDLNPANVLVTTRGARHRSAPAAVTAWDERLVLADLGLCKDLALNSGHTSAGGTDGFRPPELRRGPALIDERADLWSLSALVVWLATGAPPGDRPATVALEGTGLPPALAWALDRSLAADPAARHPDVHAWWWDVASALGASESASPGVPQAGAAAVASPPGVAPMGVPWPGGSAAVTSQPVAAPDAGAPSGRPPNASWHPVDASGARSQFGDGPEWAPHRVGGPDTPRGPAAGSAARTPWDASPGTSGGAWHGTYRTPVDAGPPASARSLGWKVRHSLWVLTALPLGFTTWAGFLVIGARADRRAWLRWSAVYGAAAVAIVVLALASPTGPDGTADNGAWQSIAGMTVMVVTWLGGVVHALVANITWLRWRSPTLP